MSKIKKEQKKINNVRLISVGASPLQNQAISKFAKDNDIDFMTFTENEWVTFEEIDQYIQEEDLSKQIISLPVGNNKDSSLDTLQESSDKEKSQIIDLSIKEKAKRLKIGRATLYRKIEKISLILKKDKQGKKAA